MRRREAEKRISRALDRVNGRITASVAGQGHVARGLAREGFDGGYAQALSDVLLLLAGVPPRGSEWGDE